MKRVLPVALALALSGCGKFTYGLEIVNYGVNGVVILNMTSFKQFVRQPYVTTTMAGEDVVNDPRTPGIENLSYVARIYPKIPHKHRDPASAYGRFPGYDHLLPDEIEVVWQLAELKECRKSLGVSRGDRIWPEVEARGYHPPDHVIKSGCTWHPMPNKIFRKKIDMAALKSGEAYQRTGKRYPGTAMSQYTLNLQFVFIEDKLEVIAKNGVTNPWR